MNRFLKPIQAVLILIILAALSSCTLGQVANPPSPTVDIAAVKTAAAATAIVELTKIAGQASPTTAPTKTPTMTPATETPAQAGNTTQNPALLSTATVTVGGLPATETPVVAPMAGTPGAVIPSLTPLSSVVPANVGPTCLNSKFVADVTIPDGTVMKPGEKFRKIWRVQNTGTCPWDQGFGFVRWAGPAMGAADIYYSIHDQEVGAGGIVDFGLEMRAPYEPGDYVAHWVMISDTGKTFGGDFTVFIKVVK